MVIFVRKFCGKRTLGVILMVWLLFRVVYGFMEMVFLVFVIESIYGCLMNQILKKHGYYTCRLFRIPLKAICILMKNKFLAQSVV